MAASVSNCVPEAAVGEVAGVRGESELARTHSAARQERPDRAPGSSRDLFARWHSVGRHRRSRMAFNAADRKPDRRRGVPSR